MPRQRAASGASTASSRSAPEDQELGSLYDYLAKIILLGPSGCGKSCLLHRFVRGEWRILSSQTIGVEFSSKIIKVGTGSRRKRIKLQLWDTAGQERFRSVTRSYYRGAAGAVLIYDITSHPSFTSLPTFLTDARALASPNLTLLLVEESRPQVETVERAVTTNEAARWASLQDIPVTMETSALSGENVDEVFTRLAHMIVTKIELGEVDPDDPMSGIQYGDSGGWVDASGSTRKRKGPGRVVADGFSASLRQWEDVFRDSSGGRRRKCC
ncbi:ras-domain-containing protein [Tuber magnatum]|uniref:Ras-domain-containing protein n=1 Tax=Tuber magnatum TaxID=42249 RepID=A0A317SJC2_9PEZI|nr:ras-domain-containing protein [Tuber magnatum]